MPAEYVSATVAALEVGNSSARRRGVNGLDWDDAAWQAATRAFHRLAPCGPGIDCPICRAESTRVVDLSARRSARAIDTVTAKEEN